MHFSSFFSRYRLYFDDGSTKETLSDFILIIFCLVNVIFGCVIFYVKIAFIEHLTIKQLNDLKDEAEFLIFKIFSLTWWNEVAATNEQMRKQFGVIVSWSMQIEYVCIVVAIQEMFMCRYEVGRECLWKIIGNGEWYFLVARKLLWMVMWIWIEYLFWLYRKRMLELRWLYMHNRAFPLNSPLSETKR